MSDRHHHKSAFWLPSFPQSEADCLELTRQFRADTNKRKPTLELLPMVRDVVAAGLMAQRQESMCLYSRHKGDKCDPRPIIEIVDYLAERLLIAHEKGWQGVNTDKTSAFAGTRALADMFSGASTGPMHAPTPTNLLELRDEKGNVIATNSRIVSGKRSAIIKLNKGLAKVKLAIDGKPVVGVMTYRVFNRTWDLGGRFYHYGQHWKKADRAKITIDGEPVVECDFSAMHICLAYNLMRLPAPSGDLYSWGDVPRKIAKLVALMMLNGAKPNEVRYNLAEGAKAAECPKDAALLRHWAKHYLDAVGAFYDVHSPIAGLMSDPLIGLRLQRMDSEIAEHIQLELHANGVACLPIHDSFIVQSKYKALLVRTMAECYRDVTEFESPLIK